MKELALGSRVEEYILEEVLGEGAFGRVYRATRSVPGGKEEYAIKHICMPTPEQYNEVLISMNNDETLANNYFKDALQGIITEFSNMRDLSRKNSRYFVTYYDHKIYGTPREYDIFVRMELLTALNSYLKQHELRIKDVLKIGNDIAQALAICHEKHMVHRDVKESNIFVDVDGDFKLGDFGVAKTLDKTQQMVSRKGTPFYMAPEMLLGKSYGMDVDIYALCVVLYKLLNCNRAPFLPPYPQKYDAKDIENAHNQKLAGAVPTLPINANNALGVAVVRGLLGAKERYHTVQELLSALDEAAGSLGQAELNLSVMKPSPTQRTVSGALNTGASTVAGTTSTKFVTRLGNTRTMASSVYGKREALFKTGSEDTIGNMTMAATLALDAEEFAQDAEGGKVVKNGKLTFSKLLFLLPVLGAIGVAMMIDIFTRDIMVGENQFINSIAFRIIALVAFCALIVIPIIVIIAYPDKKTMQYFHASKAWKKRCSFKIDEIQAVFDVKTKKDLDKKSYKNIRSALSIIQLNIQNSKDFWKITRDSRRYEKLVYHEICKLKDYIENEQVMNTIDTNGSAATASYNKADYISKLLKKIEHYVNLRNTNLRG